MAVASRTQKSKDSQMAIANKILRWRKEAVAHRATSLSPDAFNAETKLNLDDVKEVLRQIEEWVNSISSATFGLRTDIKRWNAEFGTEANGFLAQIEAAILASKGEDQSAGLSD